MDISTIGPGALILIVFIYGAAIGKLSAFGVSFGILVAGMVASYFISKFIFPNANLLIGLFTAGFYFTYLLSPAIKFKEPNEGIITMLLVLGAAGAGMGFLLINNNWKSIVLSAFIGLGLGVSSLGFTNNPKDSKFIFSFGNTSGTKFSLIPEKQKFRCDVYRNGKLISQQ
jgi:hypothetical protein